MFLFVLVGASHFDDFRIELDDISSDEERFNVIGMAHGRILYVVYTWRKSKIRSATHPAEQTIESLQF